MKIKIRDIPTFYKILFPSIAITLMVTLTSTIFTYNKASEIILKKTVRQSQETVRQMYGKLTKILCRESMTRSIT